MLIIGEKINSTRKSIERAIRKRDTGKIGEEALIQIEAGAQILDVNCGTLDVQDEPQVMRWLVETVQQAANNVPLCIDSANHKALEAGLAVHNGKAMINSISGETERFKHVLALIKEYDANVIALGMDDRGIPADSATAYEVGVNLVSALVEQGVPLGNIYFDPLVRSVATSPDAVLETLRLLEQMRDHFNGLHFASGLSNVSFGLPERKHLNRAYVVLSIASGLDAVIVDPLDSSMTALIYATEALLKKDKFCLKYIKAFKQGKLTT